MAMSIQYSIGNPNLFVPAPYNSLMVTVSIFGMGISILGTKDVPFLVMLLKMVMFLKMIIRDHSVPN